MRREKELKRRERIEEEKETQLEDAKKRARGPNS